MSPVLVIHVFVFLLSTKLLTKIFKINVLYAILKPLHKYLQVYNPAFAGFPFCF